MIGTPTLRRPSAGFRFGTAMYLAERALNDLLTEGGSAEDAAIAVQQMAEGLRRILATHAAQRVGAAGRDGAS